MIHNTSYIDCPRGKCTEFLKTNQSTLIIVTQTHTPVQEDQCFNDFQKTLSRITQHSLWYLKHKENKYCVLLRENNFKSKLLSLLKVPEKERSKMPKEHLKKIIKKIKKKLGFCKPTQKTFTLPSAKASQSRPSPLQTALSNIKNKS